MQQGPYILCLDRNIASLFMTLALLMPTKSKGESIPSIETWRLSFILGWDANRPGKLIMPDRPLTWSRIGR